MVIYWNKQRIWLVAIVACTALLAYVLYAARARLLDILRPFFLAFLVAYILNPLVNKLQRRMPRILAIILLYISFTIVILLILVWFVPRFVSDVSGLINVLPQYIQQFQSSLQKIQSAMDDAGIPQGIREALTGAARDVETDLIQYIRDVGKSVVDILSMSLSLILVPIIAFYFLKDIDYFKMLSIQLIPIRWRGGTMRIIGDIDRVLNRFIRGQLLVAAIVGLLSSIGLVIIGVNYGIIFGLLLGVFDLIPYFGPIIGSIPVLIFALLDSTTKFFLALLVIIVVQQLESSVITPKIIGDSVGLHPVYVILVLLIGGSFFGIVGMLLAVPVTLMLRILIGYAIDAIAGSRTE